MYWSLESDAKCLVHIYAKSMVSPIHADINLRWHAFWLYLLIAFVLDQMWQ